MASVVYGRRVRILSACALAFCAYAASCGASSCGARPLPPSDADVTQPPPPAKRRADVADECTPLPGKPEPKPLERQYSGVAAKARCQNEVFGIMGGVTAFLGVKCAYCHLEPNYRAMTHRKQIANWMAAEMIPRLRKKDGGEVWCNDCHVVDGKSTPKILGQPRDPRWATEWMTTVLVEKFQTADGAPLRCKDCHQANLGRPEFQKKIILTDRLPKTKDSRKKPQPMM
jgi:hypothetical protein